MTVPWISAAVTLLQPRSTSSGRLISLTPRHPGGLCESLAHILDVHSLGGWCKVYGQLAKPPTQAFPQLRVRRPREGNLCRPLPNKALLRHRRLPARYRPWSHLQRIPGL
jgi:hypothetical protein